MEINKEMTKKHPLALWPHLEALANFIPSCDEWFGSDDADQIQQTLKMVGGAVMCTLDLLKCKGLLAPDSPIKNIALVLGRLHELDGIWPGGPGEAELAWVEAAITMAKQNGITFEGAPYGVESMAGGIVSDAEDDEPEIDWYHFDWKKEFAAFKRSYSIGGTLGGKHYDLTKGQSRRKAGGGGGRGRMAITLGPGENIEDFL